jgi:hypothetical protein
LYASNDYAVYVSYNTGASWETLGTGLPVVLSTDLKIVEQGADIVLHAGTYGRAIYSVRLNDLQRGGDGTTTEPDLALENGISQSIATLANKTSFYYHFNAPENIKDLKVSTTGNNGDLDLYVKKGVKPDHSNADCSSTSSSSNESCSPGNTAGLYYAEVFAYSPFTNATITITMSYAEVTDDNALVNHQWTSLPATAAKQTVEYYVDVPAGINTLVFSTKGGSGDADLLVKYNSPATSSNNDCKSESSTSNETCTISAIKAGRYYVTVLAWNDISGTSVKVDAD